MSVTIPMYGQGHQLPETDGELVGAAAGVSAVELSAGASVGVSVGAAVGAVVGVAVGVAVGPTAFEGTVFSNFVKRFISERADLRIKSE